MSLEPIDCSTIPTRGKPDGDFTWQDNELYKVFQPLIGLHAFNVYVNLTQKAYPGQKIRYSVREVAAITSQSPATVSRSLQILECTGLVRLHRSGGNGASECELVNLKELCKQLGGSRMRRAASLILPESTVEQLRTKIQQLRIEQSGKGSSKRERGRQSEARKGGGNLFPAVSQRNTSVLQVKHQRFARETQAPPHPLLQNTTPQKAPSPTPSHDGGAQTEKADPDKDDPDALLRWARMRFTGVIDDMRDHLLDTSKPPVPHLANGKEEWDRFGFGHMAIEAAECRDAVLVLTISAPDPAEARRGLDKYHRTWDPSLTKWYEGEARVELVEARKKPWN